MNSSTPDPYEILGASRDSTAEQLRDRYLELVRQFPPDREPERFAEIRHAYDAANDPHRRWLERLIEDSGRGFLEILDERPRKPRRVPTDLLLSAGG